MVISPFAQNLSSLSSCRNLQYVQTIFNWHVWYSCDFLHYSSTYTLAKKMNLCIHVSSYMLLQVSGIPCPEVRIRNDKIHYSIHLHLWDSYKGKERFGISLCPSLIESIQPTLQNSNRNSLTLWYSRIFFTTHHTFLFRSNCNMKCTGMNYQGMPTPSVTLHFQRQYASKINLHIPKEPSDLIVWLKNTLEKSLPVWYSHLNSGLPHLEIRRPASIRCSTWALWEPCTNLA